RKQVVAIEVNRRASSREDGVKEAGIKAAGRWTRTRYEASVSGASGPVTAKLQRPKRDERRSGGRAVKGNVLTRGDLALCPKGRRGRRRPRSEKSAEVVVEEHKP